VRCGVKGREEGCTYLNQERLVVVYCSGFGGRSVAVQSYRVGLLPGSVAPTDHTCLSGCLDEGAWEEGDEGEHSVHSGHRQYGGPSEESGSRARECARLQIDGCCGSTQFACGLNDLVARLEMGDASGVTGVVPGAWSMR
jgi:hypothetical protein